MRWDPQQYARFAAERQRPFHDLLARVDVVAPRRVVDLGCGPGTLTARLAQRWPGAHVTGVDSAAEMLAEAAAYAVPGRLDFLRADVRDWRPDAAVDVLVANAVLQWVPGHLDLLAGWADALAPGGALAIQVPGNLAEPIHRLLAEVCAQPRWTDRLRPALRHPDQLAEPSAYADALLAAGLDADVWESTYLHRLAGPEAVLEWAKGTALRPVLDVLDPAEADELLAAYADRLAAAYPPGPYGTAFPFRRVFAVGRRPGERAGAALCGLDHVQLAMPVGGEGEGRRFYRDLLGLAEVAKPAALAGRGGCWFRGDGVEVHLGVEEPFAPARKAHPGLLVAGLDDLVARLEAAGAPVRWDTSIPGRRRLHTSDGFGNRIELIARA